MKINFIPEYKLFELNPKMIQKEYVEYVGVERTPIYWIDNFYKDPDKVREVALSLPYTDSKYITAASPSYRCSLQSDTKIITAFVGELFDSYIENYGIRPPRDSYASFSITNNNIIKEMNDKKPGWFYTPHVDGFRHTMIQPVGGQKPRQTEFAMVLFLNSGDECRGGTNFFRHRSTGIELPENYDEYMNIKKESSNEHEHFLIDGNREWEKIFEVSMKFNRAVFYPGCIYHNIGIDIFDEHWDNNYRLTQTGFF